MARLPEWLGRDVCEVALGIFRTVAAAGIIAAIAGGWAFYTSFIALSNTVSSIDRAVSNGILPQARREIDRHDVLIGENRKRIDRHEDLIHDLQIGP